MKQAILFFAALIILHNVNAQDTSIYRTRFWVDAPVITAGVGLTALGLSVIHNKKDITTEQLNTMSKNDLPFFDRGNAGHYNENADKLSYIPFDASFTIPIIAGLINKNERHHYGQILTLYGETMAITGAVFTLTDGLVDRSRPYVYGNIAPIEKRISATAQRSFFAGHTAATAAATFFAAKVFQDMNPDSKAKAFVWAGAAIIPAAVGYLRYKAGMHFLSDNIVGYVIGAGIGICVPQLHKQKIMQNISIVPVANNSWKGLAVYYNIK